MASKHICRRCGLAVFLWGTKEGHKNVWKHAANRHTRSCGKTPDVVERVEYEAEMAAIHHAMRQQARRGKV